MGSPSPFAIGQQTANNFGKAFARVKDENAIDRILAESMATGDPEVLQNNIGKILSQVSPERQGVAIQFLQNRYSNIQKQQEQQRASEASIKAGVTPGLHPSVQAQQLKNTQPSKASGGLSGQPVPPEISQAIPAILENNRNSNADDLAVAFDTAKIPRAYSNSYIENRRRQDEAKKPGDKFAEKREDAITEYVNHAINQGEEAEDLKFTIDTARKAIKGKVAGPGLEALAKNNPYTQLLVGLTPDEAALQASNKKLLEGSKGIFGSKPTEREIFLLLNSMLPSIGKTAEANLAGLDFIEKINDIKLLRSDIINELTDGGTKYVPDLERQVNAKVKPFVERLKSELSAASEKYGSNVMKSSNGKAIFKAPDGSQWEMTEEQVEAAKQQGVNFERIK